MGSYAIRVNRFLSLTLSLIISTTSPLRPHSFPSVTPLVPGFPPPFPTWPVRSGFCSVGRRRRSTHGTPVGQDLPGRIHGSSYVSSKMSKMLGLGGVGLVVGVGTEGGSVTAASVPCASIGSFV